MNVLVFVRTLFLNFKLADPIKGMVDSCLYKLKAYTFLLLFSCSLMACSMNVSLNSPSRDPDNPGDPILLKKGIGICTDGDLKGVTPLDRDHSLIWGDYTQLGNCEPSVTFFNPSSNAYEKLKSKITGIQHSIADGNGGWYIAGNNLKVNSKSIKHVAHISSDGTPDPNFRAFSNISNRYYGEIKDMKLANGRLYIAGDLNNRKNPNGGPVDPENGDSFYSPSLRDFGVYGKNLENGIASAVSDGEGGFFLGGSFREYLGDTVGGLIHVNANGQRSKSFNPIVSGEIAKIHYDKNTKILYIIGGFFAINGKTRFGLAAMDTLNGNLLNWSPVWKLSSYHNIKFTVSSKHGRVFVYDKNTNQGNVEIYDLSSGLAIGSYEVAGSGSLEVEALYSLEDYLYIGGSFNSIEGVSRNNVGAIDLVTNSVAAWNPNSNGIVKDIEASPEGEELFLAGNFTTINGASQNKLASVHPLTGTLNSFASVPTPNDEIFEVGVSANTVYIKGRFSKVGAEYRYRYAAFNRLTGNLTSWDPAKIKEEYSPNSMRFGKQMAVGSQSVFIIDPYIGEESRGGMFALNATTGEELSSTFLKSRYSRGGTITISEDGSLLIVGGSFQEVPESPRLSLAVFSTTDLSLSTIIYTTDNGVSKNILATDVYNNTLYVGGYFTSMGSNNLVRQHLAAIDMNTGLATSWNPNPNGDLKGFFRKDSDLFVFGNFSNILGQARDGFAVIDLLDGSLKPLTLPLAGSTIQSLTQIGTTLFIKTSDGFFRFSLLDNNLSQIEENYTRGQGFSVSNDKILIHDGYVGHKSRSGISVNGLAVLNLQSHELTPLPVNMPVGTIESVLKLSNGNLAIMGSFTDENLPENYGVILVDLKEETATSLKSDGSVRSGTEINGALFISGDFTEIEGSPRESAAAINLTDLSLSTWSPQIDSSNLVEYFIVNIGSYKNQIYLAYNTTDLAYESLGRVQRFDAKTGVPDSWGLETNEPIESLAMVNNLLVLSGYFSEFNNQSVWQNLVIDLNASDKNLFENIPINTSSSPFFLGAGSEKIWFEIESDGIWKAIAYSQKNMSTDLSGFFSRLDEDSWVQNVKEENGFIYILGNLLESNGDYSSLRVIRQSDGAFRY